MANNSSTNASIASLTTTGLVDYNAKHINYSLKYFDDTDVAIGDVLAASASRNARIHLDYTATQAQFETDSGSSLAMTVTIQYAQAP
jgi:hypothetical protein